MSKNGKHPRTKNVHPAFSCVTPEGHSKDVLRALNKGEPPFKEMSWQEISDSIYRWKGGRISKASLNAYANHGRPIKNRKHRRILGISNQSPYKYFKIRADDVESAAITLLRHADTPWLKRLVELVSVWEERNEMMFVSPTRLVELEQKVAALQAERDAALSENERIRLDYETLEKHAVKLSGNYDEQGRQLADAKDDNERWKAQNEQLREALAASLNWLDEVCNPNNEDMRTREGVSFRRTIENVLALAGEQEANHE